jgi:ATP-dependent Lon protease
MSNPNTLPETVELPLLPLRDVVVFPHMVIPLFVGRPKSIKALEMAMEGGKNILLVAQKSAAKDEPEPEDLYRIGCMANILQMLKLPDGTVKVLVEGTQRARVEAIEVQASLFMATATPLQQPGVEDHEIEAMRRAVVAQFDQFVKLNKKIPPEVLSSIAGIEDAGRLADTIAAHLPLKLEQKQEVLEMESIRERIDRLLSQLEAEIDILQVEKRIRGRVKRQMEKSQREYYLNEQVKAIQKELGEGEEGADLEELDKKIKAAGHEQGRLGQGRERVEEAAPDVADVGRSHRRPEFHRNADRPAVAQEDAHQQRSARSRENARFRSLRPRQGQGTHRRVSRGPTARRQGQGADPLPGRPSGCRQDLARPIHRQGDEPQVRPHGLGRRP